MKRKKMIVEVWGVSRLGWLCTSHGDLLYFARNVGMQNCLKSPLVGGAQSVLLL